MPCYCALYTLFEFDRPQTVYCYCAVTLSPRVTCALPQTVGFSMDPAGERILEHLPVSGTLSGMERIHMESRKVTEPVITFLQTPLCIRRK